ncbi:MAG: DUF4890 domain-containing protein [Bacteroidaceae bacterium]|nr:DUF4890 domain-containing protein [Bacteroidaceae bacterium]
MKKFILAAFALVFSMSIFAQQPQRGERREFKPEEMATFQADRMKKELDLNEEQYKALYNFYLKRGEEMKKERAKFQEGQQIDREALRAEMVKRQEAQNAEFKKILTPEQYKKYEEMQKREQERRRQGGPGAPRGPQGGQGMPPRQ